MFLTLIDQNLENQVQVQTNPHHNILASTTNIEYSSTKHFSPLNEAIRNAWTKDAGYKPFNITQLS